jgi:hypothetical protein
MTKQKSKPAISEADAIAALERAGYRMAGIKSTRDQTIASFNFKTRATRQMVVVRLCIPADSELGKAWTKHYAKISRT